MKYAHGVGPSYTGGVEAVKHDVGRFPSVPSPHGIRELVFHAAEVKKSV